MNMHFLLISCASVPNDILRRSFLATLNAVASSVHLKIKYHNNAGKQVFILADLRGARLIHKVILKIPLTTSLTSNTWKNKTRQTISMVNLEVQEDETPRDN